MNDYHFKLATGPNLSASEIKSASELLSRSYTSWQNNPKNSNPVDTDSSPEVYARLVNSETHEVILYYEGEQLCGAYIHSLSPEYDRYPIRKLSYLGITPAQKGYEALKQAISRYAEFVREQREDIVITSDLDQTTLNSLLEHAGFREVIDRNQTFFLLSQMMQRQIFSFQKIRGDFVIDQIIRLDGKHVRRDKKLLKLQTTPYDFYALYRDQQAKRVRRSVPEANRELLRRALSRADEGICFISSFDGTITLDDESRGGYNATADMMGRNIDMILPEIIDADNNTIYLLPETDEELRVIAQKVIFRPGFYDFLFFCLKVLGSMYVISAAHPLIVTYALERPISPGMPLFYKDLIEQIITPGVEMKKGIEKIISDNSRRTAYHLRGPYASLSGGHYAPRKDLMVRTVLDIKGETPTPVIYICSDMRDAPAVEKLFSESLLHKMPVLVLDLGAQVLHWASSELFAGSPEKNPYFSIINIRDFYQIPLVLEAAGLTIIEDHDFLS